MDAERASTILSGKRWYGGEIVTGMVNLEPVGSVDHVLAQIEGATAYQLLIGRHGDDDVTEPQVASQVLGRDVRTVRALGAEQSNSSVVVDDEVLIKVFRKLQHGPNPEIEVPATLSATGFADVVAPVAAWSEAGWDCAVAFPFLGSVVDGWTAALDLVGDPTDFAAAIGHLTARLHGALAHAFPTEPVDSAAMVATYRRACAASASAPRVDLLDALAGLTGGGTKIRVHGDYHLGQLLRRGNDGWYVIDFEGEPNRPLVERRQPAPPLKDLAGILRSFAYAAAVGGHGEAWEHAAVRACRDAYLSQPEVVALLPSDPEPVLHLYLLEKAVYELAYERGFRPDWAWIPEKAVHQLMGSNA